VTTDAQVTTIRADYAAGVYSGAMHEIVGQLLDYIDGLLSAASAGAGEGPIVTPDGGGAV
jgi:hypothetical protein